MRMWAEAPSIDLLVTDHTTSLPSPILMPSCCWPLSLHCTVFCTSLEEDLLQHSWCSELMPSEALNQSKHDGRLAQMVASATTLVATAVYASSRLLNQGKSLPPWKSVTSPSSKAKQADSGLDRGEPGRQAARSGEDQRGRSEGCGDAATVRACAATTIHICITDLSMPLWKGLEVHSDTWLPLAPGGSSAQQRTLAVIAPPNETESFLRTLCGMGEHVDCEGNLISFEPGWPSALQLYPTLRCVPPSISSPGTTGGFPSRMLPDWKSYRNLARVRCFRSFPIKFSTQNNPTNTLPQTPTKGLENKLRGSTPKP